jgi:hypothetical protein
MAQTAALRTRLVHPEELERIVAVHLQDVVLVACLDAHDVSCLDIHLSVSVEDLCASAADQVQLVEIVIVPVVLSPFARNPEVAGARNLTPGRPAFRVERTFLSMNDGHREPPC